jgi:hypothetical protein
MPKQRLSAGRSSCSGNNRQTLTFFSTAKSLLDGVGQFRQSNHRDPSALIASGESQRGLRELIAPVQAFNSYRFETDIRKLNYFEREKT